jgi:hypothetical protein
MQLFNATVPDGIPRVIKLSDARMTKIKRYLKQFPEREFWLTCFRAPGVSALLRGERPSPGHEGFKFTVDWLLTKGKDGTENCVKVYEGRYTDPLAAPERPDAAYHRYLTPEGYWEYPGHPLEEGHTYGMRTGTREMYCMTCTQNLGVYAPPRKEEAR